MVRICALLLTACIAGSLGTQKLSVPPPAYDGPGPVLTVWVMRGNRAGGIEGLRVAVWEDGHVLLGPGLTGADGDVVVVKTDPAEVTAAVRAVQASGLMGMQRRDYGVPCGESWQVLLTREGKTVAASWEGFLHASTIGRIDEAAYRSFVCAFQTARAAAETVCPRSIDRPRDTADLRGYNVKEPWNTGWRREQMKAGRP